MGNVSPTAKRIPVFVGMRVVDLCDSVGARRYLSAPNVEIVRKRKSKQVVQINLLSVSDDDSLPGRHSNPRRYSHDHETDTNPRGCWTLRHIGPNQAAIFRMSITDCLKAA